MMIKVFANQILKIFIITFTIPLMSNALIQQGIVMLLKLIMLLILFSSFFNLYFVNLS